MSESEKTNKSNQELIVYRLDELEKNVNTFHTVTFADFKEHTDNKLTVIHDDVLKLTENLKAGNFSTNTCKIHQERFNNFDKQIKLHDDVLVTHDKRIGNIEKWKWKVVGGLVVLAAVLKLIFPPLLQYLGISA